MSDRRRPNLFLGFDVREMFPTASPIRNLSYWESQAMLLSIARRYHGTKLEWEREITLLGEDHERMQDFCRRLIESRTMGQSLSKLLGFEGTQTVGEDATAESSANNVRSTAETCLGNRARGHVSVQGSSGPYSDATPNTMETLFADPSTNAVSEILGPGTVLQADLISDPTNWESDKAKHMESVRSPYRIHRYIPKDVLDGWKIERSKPFSHYVKCNEPQTIRAFDAAYLAFQIEMDVEAQKSMFFDPGEPIKANEPLSTRYAIKSNETTRVDDLIPNDRPTKTKKCNRTKKVAKNNGPIDTGERVTNNEPVKQPLTSNKSVKTPETAIATEVINPSEPAEKKKPIKTKGSVKATTKEPAMTKEALTTSEPIDTKHIKSSKDVKTPESVATKEPFTTAHPVNGAEQVKSTKAIKTLEGVLSTEPTTTKEALSTPSPLNATTQVKSSETIKATETLTTKETVKDIAPIKNKEQIKYNEFVKANGDTVPDSSAKIADEALPSVYDILQGMDSSKGTPNPEDENFQGSSIVAVADRCIAKATSQCGFMRDMVIWAHRNNHDIDDTVPDDEVLAIAVREAKAKAGAEGETEAHVEGSTDLAARIAAVLNETASANGESADFSTKIASLAKKETETELTTNADTDFFRAQLQIADLKKSLDAIDSASPTNQLYPDIFTTTADLVTNPTNTSSALELQELALTAFKYYKQGGGRRVLTKEDLEDGTSRPANSFGSHVRPVTKEGLDDGTSHPANSFGSYSLRPGPDYATGKDPKTNPYYPWESREEFEKHRNDKSGANPLPTIIKEQYYAASGSSNPGNRPVPKATTASLLAAKISDLEKGPQPSRVEMLEAQVAALEKEVKEHIAMYAKSEGEEESEVEGDKEGVKEEKKPKNRAERRAEARRKSKGKK